MRCDQIKAIQETLVGFLVNEVTYPKDAYHPKELISGSYTTEDN